jgi:hypothetical protein
MYFPILDFLNKILNIYIFQIFKKFILIFEFNIRLIKNEFITIL